jgi:hypothetical protein
VIPPVSGMGRSGPHATKSLHDQKPPRTGATAFEGLSCDNIKGAVSTIMAHIVRFLRLILAAVLPGDNQQLISR